MVIIPSGNPLAGGRDIVVWKYVTSGIADECAPSINSWLFSSIAGLAVILNQGYIVAAADYQGLRSPVPHPYLVGPRAAHSVLDVIRAAGEVTKASANALFAVWGGSQGGYASL